MSQKSRGRRQGVVFSLRIAPADRARLVELCAKDSGPKALGSWLVWRALHAGTTAPAEQYEGVAPVDEWRQVAGPPIFPPVPPISERLILDLCAGSGSWSEPYKAAGYPVRRVTWPGEDVRTLVPPDVRVWGLLAAPPCTEFSLAKNGQPRDFQAGLETVSACLRLVLTCKPAWWALENPVGLLSRWLGRPRFVFDPCEFGDPWTKRTAIWGEFREPTKGPFVPAIDGGGPICAECYPIDPRTCDVSDHLAVTPPGFARAFFEANP